MPPASPKPQDGREPPSHDGDDGSSEARSQSAELQPQAERTRSDDRDFRTKPCEAQEPSAPWVNERSSGGAEEAQSPTPSTSRLGSSQEEADDAREQGETGLTAAPPLPSEPQPAEDDGWQPIWDPHAQAYYFYNTFTSASTWTNPRLPSSTSDPPLPTAAPRSHGGYNPAIHGDYDPTAPYAQEASEDPTYPEGPSMAPGASGDYTAVAHFSRFSHRFIDPSNPAHASHTPDHHDDEHKSKRQMSAFFDVEAAANSHDGRSLKAERQGKKLSKQEVKAFKEKRKSKKEEKRRAWLRD